MSPDISLIQRVFSYEDLNKKINAIVTWNHKALDEAEKLVKREIEPYPIAIKDIIDVKGMKITMGSRVFIDRVAQEDAFVVKRIRESGGVIIGIANTHEFASGVTTTSSVHGPTRNPRDLNRIAGGSSGGSAAAVAAGIVPVALGTDTAGSVRIPASLTGVYGFKPTYGVISLEGVFPLAPSLDTVGILASNISWIKRIFRIIVFKRDLDKIEKIFDKKKDILSRIRIGVPRWFKASEEVYTEFMNKISSIEFVEVEMPDFERKVLKYFPVIRFAEATSIHIKYRDKWDLYFEDVRQLMIQGLEIPAHEYIEALNIRRELYREFKNTLKRYSIDFLATPTTPIPAPLISDVIGNELRVRGMLSTINVMFPSLLGLPAISVPSIEISGLPVGIQLIADRYHDLLLLELAQELKTNKLL